MSPAINEHERTCPDCQRVIQSEDHPADELRRHILTALDRLVVHHGGADRDDLGSAVAALVRFLRDELKEPLR